MNAEKKGEKETRPAEKFSKILYVAESLAKIGDAAVDSTKRPRFKELKAVSSSSFNLKHDSNTKGYALHKIGRDSSQIKALGGQLAAIGDDLGTRRQEVTDYKLKFASMVIFSVGVYATFASFELKNNCFWNKKSIRVNLAGDILHVKCFDSS